MTQEELIGELKDMTHRLIDSAKGYKKLKPTQLNARLSEASWSVLECFAHMNRYNEFYTKEIAQALSATAEIGTDERRFKSGWIGGRSANSMLPTEGKMRKMKTFKNMDPIGSQIDAGEIDLFIKHQRAFLDILRDARSRDLNKVKVKLTLPLIKFNGGDTLRFIQNHNARHMAQAKQVLDGTKKSKLS